MSNLIDALHTAQQQLTGPGSPFELSTVSRQGRDYPAFTAAPKNLRDLLGAGRVHGGQTFLVYEGEEWNFDRFFSAVDRLEAHLQQRCGVGKGDRVAIAMRNYPEWMVAYAAITSLGAVAATLNSWWQEEELVYALEDSGSTLVISDQQRFDAVASHLERLDINALVARPEGDLGDRGQSLNELLDTAVEKPCEPYPVDEDDVAVLMYTSGTTGNPKGVPCTHRNICQSVVGFEFQATQFAMVNPKAIEVMLGSGLAPAGLLAVPLFHVSGCYSNFLLSLRGGRKLVIMYKWDVPKALELIQTHKLTILGATPTQLLSTFEHPKFDEFDTSSLFSLGGGGSAAPPRLMSSIGNKMKEAYVGGGYGMTESNAACASATGVVWTHKPGSSGYLSPLFEMRSRDEDGNWLPAGQPGEICVRSLTVVDRYWNKPEATAESFFDGWFATGDVGYVDSDGFVWIVDRLKDIVIRGGENISASEVEGCLMGHPDIIDAAIVGVPHETLGEEVGALLQVREGAAKTSDSYRDYVAERMAGFKVPAHWIIGREKPARNPSGKLLKKEIRELFKGR